MKKFLILVFLALSVFVLAESIPLNTPVKLVVTADGTQPFTYQWCVDGKPIAGETKDTLVIPNFDSPRSGEYTCVVTNLMGSTTSNKLPLTVLLPWFAPSNVIIKQVAP